MPFWWGFTSPRVKTEVSGGPRALASEPRTSSPGTVPLLTVLGHAGLALPLASAPARPRSGMLLPPGSVRLTLISFKTLLKSGLLGEAGVTASRGPPPSSHCSFSAAGSPLLLCISFIVCFLPPEYQLQEGRHFVPTASLLDPQYLAHRRPRADVC